MVRLVTGKQTMWQLNLMWKRRLCLLDNKVYLTLSYCTKGSPRQYSAFCRMIFFLYILFWTDFGRPWIGECCLHQQISNDKKWEERLGQCAHTHTHSIKQSTFHQNPIHPHTIQMRQPEKQGDFHKPGIDVKVARHWNTQKNGGDIEKRT